MDLNDLRRHPDVEGPGLVAVDAADRLILDEAAESLAAADVGSVVVLDDAYGALTLGAAESGAAAIRTHQDLLTGQRALAANAARSGFSDYRSMPLDADAVREVRVVLQRLPRSLDRLDELAELVAAHADTDVVVVAGGRIKHMSTAMNDVLRRHFERVDVSHARQKSRLLFARFPRRSPTPSWPRSHHDAETGLTVVAHGGVFAGNKIDIGTRFLLDHLADAVPRAARALDLACGSGVVATTLATLRPNVEVVATDRSAAAVASAKLTAAANDVGDRVRILHADGAESLPPESVELVALNPPFHSDAALSTGIATHLFAEATRVLADDGELWCVWNSHLRYRSTLEKVVGPTRQITRNAKFTITASRRRR